MEYSYETGNKPGEMIFEHKNANWYMDTDKKGVHFGLRQHQGDDPQFPSSSIDISLSNGIELTSNTGIILRKPNGTITLDCSNVKVTGDMSVGGRVFQNTNSIATETQSYSARALSSNETTSSLSDMGHGTIGEDGFCIVNIDSVFTETVDTSNHEYYVFLQSYSDSNVHVYQKESGYFVVKGEPETQFDWEIKVK